MPDQLPFSARLLFTATTRKYFNQFIIFPLCQFEFIQSDYIQMKYNSWRFLLLRLACAWGGEVSIDPIRIHTRISGSVSHLIPAADFGDGAQKTTHAISGHHRSAKWPMVAHINEP